MPTVKDALRAVRMCEVLLAIDAPEDVLRAAYQVTYRTATSVTDASQADLNTLAACLDRLSCRWAAGTKPWEFTGLPA